MLMMQIQAHHDWFKDGPDDPLGTKATDKELADILAGHGNMPNHSNISFDVQPTGQAPDNIPKPLSIVLEVEGVDDVFTPEPDGRPSFGVNAKVRPGRFGDSNGYAGNMVLTTDNKRGPVSCRLYARGLRPDGVLEESNVFEFSVSKIDHGRD